MNEQMGKFKHGASEFQSYWLPMIVFTSVNDANEEVAHMMVFKYRKPCLLKEEASNISLEDINKCLDCSRKIQNKAEKIYFFINEIKQMHYYPSPEYFPEWEKEWTLVDR